MTSGKPKRILIKTLPKFETDLYSNLPLSDLVVFALSYLEDREGGVIPTTEEIVSICFRLFPSSFALKNYPRWPDSALVIRRLNDNREKKNIKGNPTDGFALTFKGKQVAKRIAKALGVFKSAAKKKQAKLAKPLAKKKSLYKQAKRSVLKTSTKKKLVKKPILKVAKEPVKKKTVLQRLQSNPIVKAIVKPILVKKAPSSTSKQAQVKKEAVEPPKTEVIIVPSISKEEKEKASKVIKQVERSDAYRSYAKNGRQAKISEFDFRNMLFATMESSSDTLARNVGLFKRYADIHNRNDLIKFFDFCEEHFASLLKKKR